jgi:hypothetical protein
MTREQLEHVIRASAAIAGVEDIVVIGSQSVLGQFPNAPAELLVSREADVYPLRHPERSDLIDGSIGEGSPFERQFGYYAHGVDDTTSDPSPRLEGSTGRRNRREYTGSPGLVSGGTRPCHRQVRRGPGKGRFVHKGLGKAWHDPD